MAEDRSSSAAALSDYDAIERAVAETERGRWFLAEYARRNRLAETEMLLHAIARLEQALARDGGEAGVEPLRRGLAEMEDLIAETRARVAIAPFDSFEAPALDAFAVVARTTRRVAATLAGSAGQIRDAAAALRDRGVPDDLCRAVERQAVEVSTTATIQTLAAQRVYILVGALTRLDAQVEALSGLCDGAPPCDRPGEAGAAAPTAGSAWSPGPVRSCGGPTLVT